VSPRVVLVHGAYNELWGPHEIAARWVPALRDGLWHAGADVDPADVAVCFYGDLFRREPEADGAAAFAQAREAVVSQLEGLGGEGLLASLQQAAADALYDRTVDMVTTMATVPDLNDRIAARMDAVVGPDTEVVVGHSLGSLVSYRWLTARPATSVRLLVTLGSPLGAPFVLARGGEPCRPANVERWVNVAAVGDQVAQPAELAPVYGDVEDHRIDNGVHAHHPEPYLNAACTGAAVAAALA
jgi:pimeloyl-ACP methyl ester carboxylesterase